MIDWRMNMQDFAALFEALTGNRPFPWQSALYDRFTAGMFPTSASIPTGLGKTSVVAVWLIALAKYPAIMPRRLVYVVNRRTVVDQTTTEVENLRKNLVDKEELAKLAAKLNGLAALPCDSPLAISTLRGQFADNGEWRSDPARPAVIIGTVDMIGSGLLFSRYNASFKMRPLHAGFLGQDALLVHDEAHLEPAFQTLLEAIAAEQSARDSRPSRPRDFKPLRVMALTATSRSDASPFSLTDDDRANAIVKKRFEAAKKLSLVELGKDDKLEDKIAEKTKDLNGAVLIFVRSVETALRIVDALDKGEHKGHVISLTGTMRGKERDDLVKDPRFRQFLNAAKTENTFLVATSAGEVGVNISADHCVCDLSTYESMAQRFGRVNRFGERTDSTITVFYPQEFPHWKKIEEAENKIADAKNDASKKKAKDNLTQLKKSLQLELAVEKTLNALLALNDDASPKALSEHPAPEAFSPPPEIRVATGIQFDAWALTSIRDPIAARPLVAPYLHGESDWQPSETHLAWRDKRDFEHIADRENFLDKFPLRPQELLRDTTKRIAATLERLLKDKTDLPIAWLVSGSGSVSLFPLCDFDKEKANSDLAEATLILPASLGGLENGLFTDKDSASDVSGISRSESDTRDATADLSIDISDENGDQPSYLIGSRHRPRKLRGCHPLRQVRSASPTTPPPSLPTPVPSPRSSIFPPTCKPPSSPPPSITTTVRPAPSGSTPSATAIIPTPFLPNPPEAPALPPKPTVMNSARCHGARSLRPHPISQSTS
jgi:CRISPR-associated endonuclease/helicase Cas3